MLKWAKFILFTFQLSANSVLFLITLNITLLTTILLLLPQLKRLCFFAFVSSSVRRITKKIVDKF